MRTATGLLVLVSVAAAAVAAVPAPSTARADSAPYRIYASGAPSLASIRTLPAAARSRNVCWDYRSAERGFAAHMNQERIRRGQTRLRLDPELSKAARRHTREMVQADLLHHTTSTVLRRRVRNWLILGENVGVGATVASLHKAFMASPGHRENVLYSKFRFVGIGTRQKLARLWVTVIFESRANPWTPLPMPTC